ncbi:serine protease inhibitor 77Ba [Cylas formicarius]|uniref:serine protease inhibitor 77Ba n=1 Tax=Cylas formicarius TaxID=197179 RepID=UPI0029584EAC|nr:serine protease inhibitor 77Ba [Cylas formicarius]
MKLYTILTITFYFTTPVLLQQRFSISDSINAFAVDLLAATSNEAGDDLNIALSPYTVWTLLTIVSEGALENTARQLDAVLRLPSNKNAIRSSFQNLSRLLETKSNGAILQLSNAIFTNQHFPVKEQFTRTSKQFYNVGINPVDFKNTKEAADAINKHVAKSTGNRITELINEGDIRNAQLFLTSTMFFKGEWKSPFNKSATHIDTFYDEKKNKIKVDMMYQLGVYPYSRFDDLKAEVLQLPYGFDGKFSMLIILPRGGQNVANLLGALSRTSFSSILDALDQAAYEYSEEDIHVYLPKFKVTSDFNLDRVLDKMGAKDVFDPLRANLLGIFPHYLYLSRLVQKAEIEVDEEGTVAAAASGAAFPNRSPPPKFRANKPFLYVIVDNPTRSIVFIGKISNPKYN